MKEGVEKLEATFVLSGFHLRKYVRRICRFMWKAEEILGWIRENRGKCLEKWIEKEGERLGEMERKNRRRSKST